MSDEIERPVPNFPLLRKANEWVQAEALLPEPQRQWDQTSWMLTADERIEMAKEQGQEEAWEKCGTAYCVAGYVAFLDGPLAKEGNGRWVLAHDGVEVEAYAQLALGLTEGQAYDLFDEDNSASYIDKFIRDLFDWHGERYDG